METVHEETYRGYIIKICPDYDCQSPDEWEDDEAFLVHYHRQFEVKRDDIVTQNDLAELFYNGCKNEDEDGNVIWDGFCNYHIFWITSYIHSGVSLHLGADFVHPFDSAGWDTSHCGAILIKKVKENGWDNRNKAYQYAQSLVNEWNDYLSGNVYGYNIEGPYFDHSSFGFYGDYEKDCLPAARSIVDYAIKHAQKKHIERLKTWIKNNVPLYARRSMPT